ncbi:MAG: hypothetical protein MHM6MM_002439 [Cercozoa sp. M6MM]
MSATLPISFRQVLSLQQLGIPQNVIKFNNVTFESPNSIVVRDEGSLKVIDTASQNVTTFQVPVDNAIMNPVTKIMGLRTLNPKVPGQTVLTVFDLNMKSPLKKATLSEPVMFWRWIDQKTIGIVTRTAAYHWSMDGDAQPVKMFERHADQRQVHVLHYRQSADGQFLVLGGIAKNASGGIEGVMQLYSVGIGRSQPAMSAHAACFANAMLQGRTERATLFCFCMPSNGQHVVKVIELGGSRDKQFRREAVVSMQPDDFPFTMWADDKHGVLFLLTKMGCLLMIDVQSCTTIFSKRVAQAPMFVSCSDPETGGVVAIDQTGRCLKFAVDEANIVQYVTSSLQNYELGTRMAAQYNLPGAEGVFTQQFESFLASGDYNGAARLAANAPQGVLRTIDTIRRFQQAPVQPGQPSVLLSYFAMLLQKPGTKLNQVESIEFVRTILSGGNREAGIKHLEKLIRESRFDFSEQLGDVLRTADMNLACSVYFRAKCPEKTIGCFLQLGEFQKIIDYSRSVNFQPNWAYLLQSIHSTDKEAAASFAHLLVSTTQAESQEPLLSVETVLDIFMSSNDVQTTTKFLIDVLRQRGDRPEDAALQTRLLEINLRSNAEIADSILDSPDLALSHFDKPAIAELCEQAGLIPRALELYANLYAEDRQFLEDIKRALSAGLSRHAFSDPEFVLQFFSNLEQEHALECLRDLLKENINQNIRLVVEVCKRYATILSEAGCIALFEEFDSHTGIFYFMVTRVNQCEDSEVIFKYIQAATKLGQLKEVERVCRDSQHYDAEQVRQFLLDADLKDPRPLIHVCDRHDFIAELTTYLWNKQLFDFIEVYVTKMNMAAAPKVVGSLIDLGAPEEQIRGLLNEVRPPQCPVSELCAEVEKRNRLRMMLPWLEARMHEGNEEPALHNSLAKVYVDINNNPQHFLTNNKYYDSKEVGAYCESRDPLLAFVAYRRAWGSCDAELVAVTNKHGFFKDQARYLVERQDTDLWNTVLSLENEYRRQLIDQVVATALPESRVPEEVSTTVQAFIQADLPNELIELLERIVLHGSADLEFRNNRNLQNLLILTAIRADKDRVLDYLQRLDDYDGPKIAKICLSDQHQLFEQAFFIYKKFELGEDAIGVLIEQLQDLDRAVEFANYWETAAVWGLLGKAQIDRAEDAEGVREAVKSLLKAENAEESSAQHWQLVVSRANEFGAFDALTDYLLMARKHKRNEPAIDNEIVFCYARLERLADMEDFLGGAHAARVEDCGDRCFGAELYQAAKLLFTQVNNYAKLASTLVKLEQFHAAVDAAERANSIHTWKTVCYACVDAEEFRLAQRCGVHIIVYMDHLAELIQYYEQRGHFEQVIKLLEQGINLDRAHQGIFTQLGILYAKYRPEKLMEHINMFWSRLNIPTLLGACREHLLFREAVVLYTRYKQYDDAIDLMIQESGACWDSQQFKEVIVQVSNTEVFYRAARFYLDEHPMLLNDLLIEIAGKLDHKRVVALLPREQRCLAQKYLLYVQRANVREVNEALNELYVEEGDYKGLRDSIEQFDAFDHVALAQRVEKHKLLEFRRIASVLYKKNGRFAKSIELSKADSQWQDAMVSAAESKDAAQCEQLLRYFVDTEQRECFAAMLFVCFELIKPDVVLELSWRFGLMDFAMPFMIQTFRRFDDELSEVKTKLAEVEEAKADAEAPQQDAQNAPNMGVGMFGAQPLAITAGSSYPIDWHCMS